MSEEIRIGVFVCDCGTNIAGVVDVPELVEYAMTLENVVFADATADALGRVLSDLIADPRRRGRISSGGMKYIRNRPNLSEEAERVIHIYRRLDRDGSGTRLALLTRMTGWTIILAYLILKTVRRAVERR